MECFRGYNRERRHSRFRKWANSGHSALLPLFDMRIHRMVANSIEGKLFFRFATISLLVTGGLKLLGLFQNEGVMTLPHPLFPIMNGTFLVGIGAFEICLAIILVNITSIQSKALLVCSFSSLVISYRILLNVLDYEVSCGCLGAIEDLVPIGSEKLDFIPLTLLSLLFLGSSWILFKSYPQID